MTKLDYNEDDIQAVMEMTGKTADKAEKYILEIYKDLEDDNATIFDILDVVESEVKTQENKREYVVGEKPKQKRTRERKVDNEKLTLLQMLAEGLDGIEVAFENEVKLHFNYNGSAYSVTLTKHRQKK